MRDYKISIYGVRKAIQSVGKDLYELDYVTKEEIKVDVIIHSINGKYSKK